MAGGEDGVSLVDTPTYAVAAVIAVFVFVSVAAERSIHHFGLWLKRRRRWKSLYKALDRMKEELMLLGLISLLLTAFQTPVTRICVKKYKAAMMPCGFHSGVEKSSESSAPYASPTEESHGRRLLAGGGGYECPEGKQPFVSLEGLHQLHIFIFILAIVHILYSCMTMGLAIYQIHSWTKWETDAQKRSEACRNMTDKERMEKMQLRRQHTFLKRHTSHHKIFNYDSTSILLCFGRQFWKAVHGSDYRTLRLAFIMNHRLDLSFKFDQYIIRSMEEDFQTIVGISWYLWFFVIVYTLCNIISWQFYFIIAAISFAAVCIVGTKLVHIMFTLAKEAKEQAGVVGEKLKTRDNLFWFSNPDIVLTLLHLILFTNAFEISTFIFYAWQFGIHSCFLGGYGWVMARLIISLAVQIQCSYITLPLYALVTHMGTNFKAAIFSYNIQKGLKNWRKLSRKKSEAMSYFQTISKTLNDSMHDVTTTINNTAHGLAESLSHVTSAHHVHRHNSNNLFNNSNARSHEVEIHAPLKEEN